MSDTATMDEDNALPRLETVALTSGQTIDAHPAGTCAGPTCCIHRPGDHHMVGWPQRWNDDDGMMERLCRHGKSHPDPDHMAYVLTRPGPAGEQPSGVHTCDGCCRAAAPENEPMSWRFELRPNGPLHPGEYLAEWIDLVGTKTAAVARATGIHITRLSPVLATVAPIDLDLAQRLAGHTGIPAQRWLQLQTDYDQKIQGDGECPPADLDTTWQPGDPVYPVETTSTHCTSCGASWTPAAPEMPCPECKQPMTKQLLADMLCAEAVRRYRTLDRIPDAFESPSIRASWIGQITGLRVALCALHGWNPDADAGKDGKADEMITQWWARNHPGDWAGHQDREQVPSCATPSPSD